MAGNRRILVGLAVLALVLTACQGGETGGGGGDGDVKTDIGVTTEPCPGGNAERDCIYLGVLSDLTEGPFRALAVPITEGQKAFWKRVNDQGGIGGRYEVNIETYTRDNKYNPQEHVAKYREIEPKILALGQTLGTPPTLAGLPLYKEADIIAAPASWWSGWEFEDVILESGYSYCTEAMNGLDWASEEFGKPSTIMAVHYPGDYGGDSAAGVAEWAKVNGVDFQAEAHNVQTTPNAQAGNQDAVVERILRADPDVVMVATGPAEMAEIVGRAAAQGFKGRFIGSVPTYNPALLKSEAAPAIKALYHFVSPWGPWGSDTPGPPGHGAGRRRQDPGQRRLHLRLDLVLPPQGRPRARRPERRPYPGRRPRRRHPGHRRLRGRPPRQDLQRRAQPDRRPPGADRQARRIRPPRLLRPQGLLRGSHRREVRLHQALRRRRVAPDPPAPPGWHSPTRAASTRPARTGSHPPGSGRP